MPPAPTAAGSALGASRASLGDLYSKCVQMVNENKVSTKNAFDLRLIEHMDDIVDSFMGGSKRKKVEANAGAGRPSSARREPPAEAEEEHRFHEASCTIEASARIYACRVDCVHTDTYRVLGGLSAADMGDEEEGREGEDGQGTKKRRRIVGVNTLERNEKNIIQADLELDEMSDPMFRRMAAAFDAGGAKGLLLGHLPLAEDLSLVFNGDVPLARGAKAAVPLFAEVRGVSVEETCLGDPAEAASKIAASRLCPEIDGFRRKLYGGSCNLEVTLPENLEALLGAAAAPPRPIGKDAGAIVAATAPGPQAPGAEAPEPLAAPEALGPPDMDMEAPQLDDLGADVGAGAPFQDPPVDASDLARVDKAVDGKADSHPLPLTDGDAAFASLQPIVASSTEDAIAFDELFEKFCGGGGSHQFAYFDECWSKAPKDGKAGFIADGGAESQLVAQEPPAPKEKEKEKPSKKPLFDLSGMDKPVKPIETEPAHKHQLSERAAQWQLHKDVPPYMIDRITMPSWSTWSKCDFACLGLRPHLMLKLVRKPAPPGDGPHSFSDLFSTVVVENPDAFPWLGGETRGGPGGDRDDGMDAPRGDREADVGDDAGDEDFDGNGLPAHLDVNPEELFLRPGDTVLQACDGDDVDADVDDMPGGDVEDGTGFAPGIDFDLADRPATVGSTEIGYSTNSKFVDVKLVKKHLWDCISEDMEIARVKGKKEMESGFQNLVNRTVKRMPKGECENLSVAVCFICALHLCNEKNLELRPAVHLGDFNVVAQLDK